MNFANDFTLCDFANKNLFYKVSYYGISQTYFDRNPMTMEVKIPTSCNVKLESLTAFAGGFDFELLCIAK